jgi:hypothetical protein
MNDVTNAQEYEKELTRIFNRFNNHFWNNELPEVIITFVPTQKAYGHITTSKVWVSDDGSSKYELNISAYFFDRSPDEMCATLLHEQCHLYNMINNRQDTSNHNRYHNKVFKKTAEDHGLIVSYDKSIGWSHSELTEESKAYVRKLNIKSFAYKRDYVYKGSNLRRFSCPKCEGPVVYSVQDQHVLCGFCKTPLVYMPKKKAIQE